MLDFHRVATRCVVSVPLLLACVAACSSAPEAEERTESSSDGVTGTLVKYIGRANDGSTVVEYYVNAPQGRLRLVGQESALGELEPNIRVRVRGAISPERGEILVTAVEPAESERGRRTQALSSSAPPGSVAVFLIKDSSLPGDPIPVQDVRNTLFDGSDSSNNYFQEVSYGQYGLTGDVFGWYSADLSSCSFTSQRFFEARQQAAAEDGFVTDNYRHAVALFERDGEDCFYAFASIGSPDGVGETQSFVHNPNVFVHEIGHNLGLHHANSFICRNSSLAHVPYGTNCTFHEYWDPYDAMGFDGFYYHFNSRSKELQGWLPQANVQRVEQPGQFQIVPQQQAASAIQSLLIPIPGTTELYHVEMRRQFGFDDELRFEGAVLVRRVSEAGLNRFTYLLDMSPDGDPFDASMSVGQVFADPLSGVSIELVARTANQATVEVSFGGPHCGDGVQNGQETDVDCGGVCEACTDGQGCSKHRDCESLACSAGTCVASGGGLSGQYFSGTDFEQLQFTRVDKVIDFEWGESGPSSVDEFSIRWQGKVIPLETAVHTFRVDTDDGVRLWVDDQLIIDRWFDSVGVSEGTIALQSGQQYDIRLEYFESFGGAYARLMWSTPSHPLDLVPPTHLLPVTGCSAATAVDLGARNVQTTVPSDACVTVTNFPEWWQYTSGNVTVQSGNGTFPVAVSWQNVCTQSGGQSSFDSAWQSLPIGSGYDASCPAVLQLGGTGAPIQLSWW